MSSFNFTPTHPNIHKDYSTLLHSQNAREGWFPRFQSYSHGEGDRQTGRRKRVRLLIKQTGFLDEHPGGSKILKRMAGKDASKQFWKYHGKSVLEKYGGKLRIGTLAESAKL